MKTIKDLETRTDLQLVTDSQEVEEIMNYLNCSDYSYGGLFVSVENGDYKEVWGFNGIIPYHSKSVWQVK